MKVARSIRMTLADDSRTKIQVVALMIATLAKRKNVNRWKMGKRQVRELLNAPVRANRFVELSDALAEYGVMLMDLDDKFFGFILADKTDSWYRMGLSGLTDDERRTPDVDKLEDEIGYTGCDIGEEDEGDEA